MISVLSIILGLLGVLLGGSFLLTHRRRHHPDLGALPFVLAFTGLGAGLIALVLGLVGA